MEYMGTKEAAEKYPYSKMDIRKKKRCGGYTSNLVLLKSSQRKRVVAQILFQDMYGSMRQQ